MTREDILFELKSSKLKGRGGAGFPTSTKWMLTAAAKADKKFHVCNADEGEPGTFKDRVLLMEFPELVFDGMVVGGYTIGAQQGIDYLRGEYEYLLKRLTEYLEVMRKDNLLGKNILGKKDFNFDIEVFLGSGAYVCGEETALIESLEGHRGEPRNRPPYPINTGYLGRPTSVNNVETLAAVSHIVVKGGSWFAKFGTNKSTGSKLFSVSGDCEEPGVYELPWGIKISELLEIVGAKKTKAVQIGGASGQCIPKSQFDRTVAYEDVAQVLMFQGTEHRFGKIAKTMVILAGLSGLYLITVKGMSTGVWMMIILWAVYASLLFGLEKMIFKKLFGKPSDQIDTKKIFSLLQGFHWIVLTVSFLAVAAGIWAAHG